MFWEKLWVNQLEWLTTLFVYSKVRRLMDKTAHLIHTLDIGWGDELLFAVGAFVGHVVHLLSVLQYSFSSSLTK